MARSHAAKPGGIAQLRSKFPEIIAELPPLSFEAAMRVAEGTAKGATEQADQQYQGDDNFNIEARAIDASGTETHDGKELPGVFVTGHTLNSTIFGAHVLTGKAAGVYADWYWFFGEFGSMHQPARPFMIPAFEEARTAEWPGAAAVFNRELEGFGV